MSDPQTTDLPRVGVVGAGQLALMMGEAAAAARVTLTVLALEPDEPAVATSTSYLLGAANDEGALRNLAREVDVITFDHELVDLDLLGRLESEGVVFRPDSAALRFSVDKAYQRESLQLAGIAVPRFLVVRSTNDERLAPFLDELTSPPVVKSARGGYDGRGVVFAVSRAHAIELVEEMLGTGDVVVEERLVLLGEVAQLVARSIEGVMVFYPVVSTLQREGMCVEVQFPSDLDDANLVAAEQLSRRVASLIGGVGILAIEYFLTAEGLLVNEVALRPHNSGHWTIEGTTTSQFTQHLRAVSGQALEAPSPRSTFATMVNVVGSAEPGSLDAAKAVAGVYVHDYAKTWRPGRKLGHVTALGDEREGPRVRAWTSARACGTATQES